MLVVSFLIISQEYDLQSYFQTDKIRESVESFGVFAPLIYIIIHIVSTLLFLPATILTISSGVLFGFFKGAMYTIIAATIGSTLAFILSRYLVRDFAESVVKKRFKSIHKYDEKLKENGFTTVLFLRLIPLFHFNSLNLSLGITKVRLKDYFYATFIGIIPGTLVYAYFGDSIAKLSTMNIILATVLIILSGISIVLYNIYKRRKKEGHHEVRGPAGQKE